MVRRNIPNAKKRQDGDLSHPQCSKRVTGRWRKPRCSSRRGRFAGLIFGWCAPDYPGRITEQDSGRDGACRCL